MSNEPQPPSNPASTTTSVQRVSRIKLRKVQDRPESTRRKEAGARPTKDLKQAHSSEICADCHPDAVDGFLATGMGRSLRRIETVKIIERFEKGRTAVTHAESGLTYRTYVDEQGRWWQEESLSEKDFARRIEVKYVVGSGNHGRTYLGEDGGEIVELPLTWYSQKGLWDLSPSYKTGNMRFGRHIRPRCLFCHNDFTPSRDGTIGGYTEPLADGMSCVRCHGDASEHVKMRTAGKGPPAGQPDPTILNPARLPPSRQMQVCQQCHLVGEARLLREGKRWDTYDVRTPLEEYMSIFVPAGPQGPEFGIASHGYRLSQSACAKDERLTCSTCHNVHKPNTRADYRIACLSCHTQEACGDAAGQSHTGDCAQCHMRKGGTDDTPHVSFTDHYIRKNPDKTEPAPRDNNRWGITNALGDNDQSPTEIQLRQGLAHFARFMSGHSAEERQLHGERGIAILKEVIAHNPTNGRAQSAIGRIYEESGQTAKASPHYSAAIKADPANPLLRMYGGKIARKLGQLKDSILHYQVATRIRPDFLEAWVELGRVLAQSGQLEQAKKALGQAEVLAPRHSTTAINLGLVAQKEGFPQQARTWFQEAIKRDPVNMMGHLNLCMLEFAMRNFSGALKCADDSLALHPRFADGYWIRGRAHFTLGDLDAARKDLQSLIEIDPNRENGYLDLARVERAAGQTEKARAVLLRARAKLGTTTRLEQALTELKK